MSDRCPASGVPKRPPGCGPPVISRARRPAGPEDTALTVQGLAGAIALITDSMGGSGASQAEILGDAPRGPVIAALISLATASLRIASSAGPHPTDDETVRQALQSVGLLAAAEESE